MNDASTLANLSLRTPDADAVFDLLDEAPAFVSPAILGWVTVFDSWADHGDLGRLADIGAVLTEALSCSGVAFLIAGDVLVMLVFDKGQIVDEYASDPDFFGALDPDERLRIRGRPDLLLPLAVPGTRVERFGAALHRPDLTAIERLAELSRALGIENTGFGYHHLLEKSEGRAEPEVVGWDLFAQAEIGEIDGVEDRSL